MFVYSIWTILIPSSYRAFPRQSGSKIVLSYCGCSLSVLSFVLINADCNRPLDINELVISVRSQKNGDIGFVRLSGADLHEFERQGEPQQRKSMVSCQMFAYTNTWLQEVALEPTEGLEISKISFATSTQQQTGFIKESDSCLQPSKDDSIGAFL
jgi:hypothetical protein